MHLVTHTYTLHTPLEIHWYPEKPHQSKSMYTDFNAFNCLQIEYMCTALISWKFSCRFALFSVLFCFCFSNRSLLLFYFFPFRPMWICVFRSVSLHVMLLIATLDTYILALIHRMCFGISCNLFHPQLFGARLLFFLLSCIRIRAFVRIYFIAH